MVAVGVRLVRYCWTPAFLRVCRRNFSSLARLLYLCLSCGARVICHLFRAFRFSVSFCFKSAGQPSWMCCSCRGGVVYYAACWIAFVRVATASPMSMSVFNVIVRLIRASNISRKASQPVYLVYKDGFFGIPRM